MSFRERYLIEEAMTLKKLKPALWTGLGGMAGAGLDLYLSGKVQLDDYIKPLAAWGAGGVLGSLGADLSKDKKEESNSKSK